MKDNKIYYDTNKDQRVKIVSNRLQGQKLVRTRQNKYYQTHISNLKEV